MHLTHRKTCRICGSKALTKVIDLGEQYLQGSFVKPGKEMPPLRNIPLTLHRCDPMLDEKACGLLQLAHTVPPAILYSAYWYRSGTNKTMTDHLAGIAAEAVSLIGKDRKARVLDIGCNDGTLLKSYPDNFVKFGIDPSDVANEISDDICVVRDLFPSFELKSKAGAAKFDVITSIAMFYDLEDPISFVREIKNNLMEDGIWIFEMSYMPMMLEMNSYDTICHEHLEYYSLAVVENILGKAGMKIVRAQTNDINGGSIRCFASHENSLKYSKKDYSDELASFRLKEFDLELDTDKPYRDFQKRIDSHRRELIAVLKKLKKKGKRIHIYGASTKGNTILQFCGIDKKIIDFAAERNPDKYGARTLGTDIPIISEAESRKLKPDFYLVLPWHFKKEFLEREKSTLESGIGFIFPLPVLEIVAR
jgi:SAM-dependent methyltransferase